MEESQQHLFITGKAGTGKSTLLDYFSQSTKKVPVMLAPTGIAALNVKGQTIHRFFNFYVNVTPETIRNEEVIPKKKEIYKKLQTIIIDEVSMLRADLLDCIDVFLQMYGPNPSDPFGGVQMIFVGDLYQLPPVVNQEEREIFQTHYSSPYFFSAKALQSTKLETIELKRVYRQKDQDFIDLLNKIRNNSVDEADLQQLNQRYFPELQEVEEQTSGICLTTTNKKVDEINQTRLDALDGKMYQQGATISGEFGKEYYPTVTTLQYKVGAQIMLLNNDQQERWFNGSIGTIQAIDRDPGDDFPHLVVKLHNDKPASKNRTIYVGGI